MPDIQPEIGSRLIRLPVVVLVTIGLLLSLLHCTGSGFRSPRSTPFW